MLLVKAIHSCLYTGLLFSARVLACPDYENLPRYKAINGSDRNSTELIKRYYTVEPSEDATRTSSTWPGSTLPYCFENAASKAALARIVEDGWKMWQAAGVDYNIHMGEYNNCPAAAANGNVPKGSNYLLIQLNNNGKFLTTVGHQIYSAGSGASMQFDPSANVAMRNPVANMAHEIGHAWGFLHEQQRTGFWAKDDYTEGTGSTNQIIFTCTNLADYDNTLSLDGSKTDACHSQIVAKSKGFSAMEYLPMAEAYSVELDDNDFDWDSIMLYGSAIGGRVVNGIPMNVYKTAVGLKVIPYNTEPSQRDVERFGAMYSKPAKFKNPCLINQGCSPGRAMYMNAKAKCKKAFSS